MRRGRSSINLLEGELSSEVGPEDICQGKPEVLGGWTREPTRKQKYARRHEKLTPSPFMKEECAKRHEKLTPSPCVKLIPSPFEVAEKTYEKKYEELYRRKKCIFQTPSPGIAPGKVHSRGRPVRDRDRDWKELVREYHLHQAASSRVLT